MSSLFTIFTKGGASIIGSNSGSTFSCLLSLLFKLLALFDFFKLSFEFVDFLFRLSFFE